MFQLAAEVWKYFNRFFRCLFIFPFIFFIFSPSLCTFFCSATWLPCTLRFARCGTIKAHLNSSAALLSLYCRITVEKLPRKTRVLSECTWSATSKVLPFASLYCRPTPEQFSHFQFGPWVESHFSALRADHSRWNKHHRQRSKIHKHQKRAEMRRVTPA